MCFPNTICKTSVKVILWDLAINKKKKLEPCCWVTLHAEWPGVMYAAVDFLNTSVFSCLSGLLRSGNNFKLGRSRLLPWPSNQTKTNFVQYIVRACPFQMSIVSLIILLRLSHVNYTKERLWLYLLWKKTFDSRPLIPGKCQRLKWT